MRIASPGRRHVAAAALLSAVCWVSACDSPAKRGDAVRTPPAAATATRQAAETSAPQGGLSNSVRAGWAELVGREPPETFANADEQRFYATCLAFTRALQERAGEIEEAAGPSSRDPAEPPAVLRAVEAVQKNPPDMPTQDAAWCAEYTIKAMKYQLAAGVARQAEMTLQAMAGAMAAAHARAGKLCPPTEKPVPADVELIKRGPHTPKPEEWEAPTWRCMRFRWLRPLRFQYEVRTDATGFVLIARGSPAADGQLDEYRLEAKLRAGKLELGDVKGRFLQDEAPAPVLPATSP